MGAGAALPYWIWLTVGLLLAASEMLATQFVLIWFGGAAFAVGLLTWIFPDLGLVGQLVIFGVLSAAFLVPMRTLRRRWRNSGRGSRINDRAAQQVGRIAQLKEPILGGEGRVFIGDTLWHVEGPDLPAGATIRVVSFDNSKLIVDAAN